MQTVLSQRRELWLLLTLAGIQFTHVLDFMIIMPLGPQLRDLFAINDAQFGFLVSAYTFAAGISGLLAASFVDRFERKRLMLILYTLFGLTTLACAWAPTYELLMASRVAAGTFGGILSAMTQTVIGDVIPFERRGRATGFVMTSFAMATVVGVPSGLFLANIGGWHSAFLVIAFMCLVVGVMAVVCLPKLDAHVHKAQGQQVSYAIRQVLADANHRKALYMSGAMMFAGFTIIPYITIFTQANHILAPEEIPYIYLCGGAVTLLSARWVGRLSDKLGKRKMFQRMLVLTMLPMTITTLLHPVPLPWVLLVFAAFFFCMNARMIPGMAMLTSAAQPQWRGTFMSLNSAVQSVSIGLASWLGGVLIQRDTSGQVTHFWLCALVGIAATVLALAISRHVEMHSAPESAVP